jgi:hypothetical protein
MGRDVSHQARTDSVLAAYSAAVCELSDACDMLLARGFDDVVVDCKSAMTAYRKM